jgi:hypothetical protein
MTMTDVGVLVLPLVCTVDRGTNIQGSIRLQQHFYDRQPTQTKAEHNDLTGKQSVRVKNEVYI